MKKVALSFDVLAAIIAVTILQACANVASLTTQCATPKLDPPGGSGPAGSSISVRISTATVGARLRYTTDGSKPTSTYGTLIAAESGSAPIPCVFGRTLKLQAIAFKPGLTDSAIAVGYYTASN
jgi:hypothetical protein